MEELQLKESIKFFFNTISKLKKDGLFSSDKYLGDIGEKICEHLYGITLCENGRQVGYDGTIGTVKYQIKLHNSPTRTNVYLGNPDKYDKLLLVIGFNSLLKKHSTPDSFAVYEFDSTTIKNNYSNNSGYSFGKNEIPTAYKDLFVFNQ